MGAGKQETSAGSYGIVAWASCGQEFVPSLSNLVAVEVRIYLAGSNPVVGVELALAVREGTITGTVVPGSQQSQYLSLGVGFEDWIRFDFAAPLSVLPGSKYVIQLAGAGQGSNLLSWTCSSSALSYLPGKPILQGNPSDWEFDFTFRTYAEVSDHVPSTPQHVGGAVFAANKLAVLSPYLALIGLAGVVASAALVVKRRKL